MVLALSSITLEMLECKEIGQREYYAPLALFGDVPHGCPPRSMDEVRAAGAVPPLSMPQCSVVLLAP